PGLHAVGRHDVAALAVGVQQQGDVRAAVRVVLDALHARRDPVLVPAEIDDPVALLVAAALVAHRDAAVVVAAGLLRLLAHQRHVRIAAVQAGRDDLDDAAAPGRSRLRLYKGHLVRLPS